MSRAASGTGFTHLSFVWYSFFVRLQFEMYSYIPMPIKFALLACIVKIMWWMLVIK